VAVTDEQRALPLRKIGPTPPAVPGTPIAKEARSVITGLPMILPALRKISASTFPICDTLSCGLALTSGQSVSFLCRSGSNRKEACGPRFPNPPFIALNNDRTNVGKFKKLAPAMAGPRIVWRSTASNPPKRLEIVRRLDAGISTTSLTPYGDRPPPFLGARIKNQKTFQP